MAPVRLLDFIVCDLEAFKNKKIYLLFDKNADALRNIAFMLEYMFHKEVYVHGMASKNKKDVGIKAFHKQVVDITTLNEKDAVIIKWESSAAFNERNVYSFFNDKLKGKKAVVYGTGMFAKEVCRILDSLEVDIRFFVDKDRTKTGNTFKNKCVFWLDKLNDLSDRDIVIEAAYKWEDMETEANLRCPDTARFYYDISHFQYIGMIYAMYTRIGDRTISLYGRQKSVDSYSTLYRYFDFHVECIYCAEENEYDKNNISMLTDSVNSGNFVLLSKKKNVEDIAYFEKIGMEYLIDFAFSDGYEVGRYTTREMRYDINLGYTYLKNCKYPGIQVYGDEKNAKYKIVCIGNSTTDGYIFPIKSWPEFLWEIAGNEYCIYNAGCEGYNVVQDFMKLIRDMLGFSPDMIIEVSGMNETWWNESYPFQFNYLKEIYSQSDYIYRGGVESEDFWHQWIFSIAMMKEACRLKNVQYHAFLQPMLAGKSNRNTDEESRLLSWFNILQPKRFAKQESFGRNIDELKKRDIEEQYCFLHNLTGVFDEVHDVYIDECHVTEEGNNIIAKKIWEIVHMDIKRR